MLLLSFFFPIKARLENISTDSQVSPCEDQCLKIIEIDTSPSSQDAIDSSTLPEEKFARSGITITDDEITLDVSSSTGLRKTGFSDQIYSEMPSRKTFSKIPRSPLPVRRKSVENLCATETGLPLIRSIPQYRSVRKPTTSSMAKETAKENTWSGRTTKRRPSLSNDTYQSQSKPNSPSPSRRITPNRPPVQYDQNGRRIKPISASTNTSPIKTRITSPLAQQFLEVAGEAKDDAQFLKKMKALLAQYTNKNETSFEDDFTTAWVNGNGTVERAKTGQANKTSKTASTASTSEPSHPKDIQNVVNTRRTGGLSRIPAPVRANTGLY